MPKPTNKLVERIQAFRAAWREMAPEAVFAGMTLAQFEEKSEASLSVRGEILAIVKQLTGKKAEKSIVDQSVVEHLVLVVNSVRGTPGYGEDCALYRALGYVRKSDRKSGLTRKGSSATKGESPSTDAQ